MARIYGIKLPPLPTGYCTYYSEKHGGPADEKHVVSWPASPPSTSSPTASNSCRSTATGKRGVASNGPPKDFAQADPKRGYPHE